MQKNDQGVEQQIALISNILSDGEFKCYFIEKHTFDFVKEIKNFWHYILGNHTKVRVSLPAVKFMLSQIYL